MLNGMSELNPCVEITVAKKIRYALNVISFAPDDNRSKCPLWNLVVKVPLFHQHILFYLEVFLQALAKPLLLQMTVNCQLYTNRT